MIKEYLRSIILAVVGVALITLVVVELDRHGSLVQRNGGEPGAITDRERAAPSRSPSEDDLVMDFNELVHEETGVPIKPDIVSHEDVTREQAPPKLVLPLPSPALLGGVKMGTHRARPYEEGFAALRTNAEARPGSQAHQDLVQTMIQKRRVRLARHSTQN